MSQKVNEKQNPRDGVTEKQKVPESTITGLSPDDGVDVKSGDTGQKPVLPPPPPPP